nr:hypothetical protein CFP56_05581 [Quercus suber]
MEKSSNSEIQHASLEHENQNNGIHEEANTSSGNETQMEWLVKGITTMFESLQPPFSIMGRINVPDHLRKVDEEAYNPMVISLALFITPMQNYNPWKSVK